MERKIVDVIIPYFEKGEEKTKEFVVKFISRRVIKEYSEIMSHLMALRALSADRQKYVQEMGYAITDKTTIEKRREELKKFKDKKDEVDDKIEQLSKRDIAAETLGIVSRILEDNGIEDDDLKLIDFWEEHTEETDLWHFLNSVVYKDVAKTDSKKKELSTT